VLAEIDENSDTKFYNDLVAVVSMMQKLIRISHAEFELLHIHKIV